MTDFKAQVLDSLEESFKVLGGCQAVFIKQGLDIQKLGEIKVKLEETLTSLYDPNVFVGRWETDMSKAPKDGTPIPADISIRRAKLIEDNLI